MSKKCADLDDVKRKLNPDEIEFIFFGTKSQRAQLAGCFPVDILGNCLIISDKIRNLGILIYADLIFSNHVMSVCRACLTGTKIFEISEGLHDT